MAGYDAARDGSGWMLQRVASQASFGANVLAVSSGTLRVDGIFAIDGEPTVDDVSALFDFTLATDSELLMLDGVNVTAVATGKIGRIAADMQAQLDFESIAPSCLQALSIQARDQLALAMDDSESRLLGDYRDSVTLETKPTALERFGRVHRRRWWGRVRRWSSATSRWLSLSLTRT